MNYRSKLQYFLVQKLKCSNQEAKNAMANGLVSINNSIITENCFVSPYQKINFGKTVVQDPANFTYLAYYKPRGIECTLNVKIESSLAHVLPAEAKNLFYAGRLDKASEGLLLLTNDGHLYNKIIQPQRKLPKVYWVKLEKPYEEDFKTKMENGIEILGKTTLPCKVILDSEDSFYIELTQGLNRQIRRMCFSLDNYVTELKRLRIGPIQLIDFEPNSFRYLSSFEIAQLQNL